MRLSVRAEPPDMEEKLGPCPAYAPFIREKKEKKDRRSDIQGGKKKKRKKTKVQPYSLWGLRPKKRTRPSASLDSNWGGKKKVRRFCRAPKKRKKKKRRPFRSRPAKRGKRGGSETPFDFDAAIRKKGGKKRGLIFTSAFS